jgi:hypothetical protein
MGSYPHIWLAGSLLLLSSFTCLRRIVFLFSIELLDDPLRHWRKDKSKAALAPQRVNYSNLNKNSSLENLMLSKFLDECSSTSIIPTFFV